MNRSKSTAIGLGFVFGIFTFTNIAVTQETNRVQSSISKNAQNNDYLKKLPPLIDREVFFGDPQITSAQISPDGKFLAFRKPHNRVMNIWVNRLDQPLTAARVVTNDQNRPIREFYWNKNGKYLLYLQDTDGSEKFHVFAVALDGKSAVRDLTPINDVSAQIYAIPKKISNSIIVGLNDRNPQLHDVYRINLSNGERKLLVKNDANIIEWIADLDGNVRLGVRLTANGGREFLRVDGKALVPVYSCNVEETCEVLRFHKDNQRVYLKTNKGNVDLTRLVLFNPQTAKSEFVDADPQKEVDLENVLFSEATDELIATTYKGDHLRIYPKNKEFARDLSFLQKTLPSGDLDFTSATNDDNQYTVTIRSDVNPGSGYLMNRKTRTVKKLYDLRPELPSKDLATMRPIRYTARDGLQIPAYITVPKGLEARNLPLVVTPHGGPWRRDTWGYEPFTQFLANRGYVVLQPNFRGSSGYGKAFLNAGNKQWGTGAMQHDITDGVKYLIKQGIADPKRIAIYGASYGGYAALAGLAFTPYLYAAGVSYVGISNILTFLKAIPAYWEPTRPLLGVRIGNPKNPQDLARLHQQSPLFSAKQIKAPLLVIQGANDPRVKKAESDQIVSALHELGRDVEYLIASNEGHGFRREDNKLAITAAIERFLATYIGGRYQKSLSPEIEARLKALIVDVTKVTAPEPLSTTTTNPSFQERRQ